MENLSGAFDQEEWEYFNLRTGDEEMTQYERDEEFKMWRNKYDRETAAIRAKEKDWTYSSEYAGYIMEHSKGDRLVCNGDMLLDLQEQGYLYQEFLQSIGELA